ncbi:MAG: class I SAM-dependent methyltransferase [Acidobacteria bacterium]|nr:class I SAM-dependent methyltransferase [Acidobacteriota bacterium]
MNDQHLTPPHLQDCAVEMKHDWDDRARYNAKWFINTYKLEQSDEEFGETGRLHTEELVVDALDLLTQRRDPRSLRLLEIGCGIGRMTSHLAGIFGEVYAVDVSHEMVQQARARLAHLPNVTVHETSGYDFVDFPDDFFDLVFSAYVFQHVPNADVIRRNICDAYRVLRPGGMFKFQTSGIASEDHAKLAKNTWTGSAFPAEDIRLLAHSIGAQLVSLSGIGTQYLWTVLRKSKATNGSNAGPPRIILSGWDITPAPDEPPDGHSLTLLITGVDPEVADANTVKIFLGDKNIAPNYVGLATPSFLESVMLNGELDPVQVNCRVPEGTPAGLYEVRVVTGGGGGGVSSLPEKVDFQPLRRTPVIKIVSNILDGGLDLYNHGPKSLIRVFVAGLKEEERDRVVINIAGRRLQPDSVEFIEANQLHLCILQLPEDIQPGETSVQIILDELRSTAYPVKIDAFKVNSDSSRVQD